MSWGIDILVDHGDGYVTTVEVVNGHTYNLTPMWRLAGIVGDRGTSELGGRTCKELKPILMDGLADAWSRPAAYRELDPPNGWGDFDGFIEILTRFTRLVHEHPTGRIEWNG